MISSIKTIKQCNVEAEDDNKNKTITITAEDLELINDFLEM